MKRRHTFHFDAEHHQYSLDGYGVPSVTQIVNDVLPGWQADPWYLAAGRTVHATLAMLAKGQTYTLDLSSQTERDRKLIEGRIEAGRKFLGQYVADVLEVEKPVCSRMYAYAGTFDLVVRTRDGHIVLVDWKGHLDKRVKYQLGGYAVAVQETLKLKVTYGVGVGLDEDGCYRMSHVWRMDEARPQFLALLTAYNLRRVCGVKAGKSNEEGRT